MKHISQVSVLTAALLVAATGQAAPSNAQLNQEIRTLSQQTAKLQQQVSMLKAQRYTNNHHVKLATPSHALRSTNKPANSVAASPLVTRFNHPVTVTTSPLLGNRPITTVSEFLQEYSTINEDLTLLQQRSMLAKALKIAGSDINRPIIELSGALEGQIYSITGFNSNQDADASSSGPHGIDLSKAEFDVNAIIGPWVGGFMALKYDNAPASTGNRQPISTLYLDRGFLTIGNLNSFPMYFTAGEMIVPFGKYSSMMLTTPVTQSMARIRSATALIGFAKSGFFAEGYGYSGEQTNPSNNTSTIKQGGVNAGYTTTFGVSGNNSIIAGAGLVTNIADSQGMQNTGNNTNGEFQGFAQMVSGDITGNDLQHRVPAFDTYGVVGMGPWTFIAEFVTGLRDFSAADLSFNGNGANVKALHTEIDYTFHIYSKPVNLGASFGHTWQALALDLPQDSYTADVATSLFRNTVEQIEYRHDTNYKSSDFASGALATQNINGTSSGRNTIIGQIGVYF